MMKTVSGAVAFINTKGEVDRVKDLGPNPIRVHDDGRVLPLVDVMPEISSGEIPVFDRYEVLPECVHAIYRKEAVPIVDRLTALEAEVAKIKTMLAG